jgi:hypothetical protein
MIFMNMNLDGLTCIKKIEVLLQVVIRTWFKYYFKKGFKFEFELKPRYMVDYTTKTL